MNLEKKQSQFALYVASLIDYIHSHGYSCTLGEAYRTPEQAQIYATQGKGIKDSLHCKRLAIDLNLFDDHGKYLSDTKDYEKFGVYWEGLDELNRWGGRFLSLGGKINDPNHFELRDL